MQAQIDHLVVAATDLGWLCDWWRELTGVDAAPGGAHPGWGTRNALVGLGSGTYLELIGPDPDQPDPERPRPFGIDGLAPQSASLVTFAVAVEDLEGAVALVREHGLDPGPITPMSRVRPDGVRLAWRLATPVLATHGGLQPFLIEWGDETPHPSTALSAGVRLVGLTLAGPDAEPIGALLSDLELGIGVAPADRPMLSATLASPNGMIGLGNH